ncbi:MAG: SET domain-containing protein, partial [Patescibacteria group bacterium]
VKRKSKYTPGGFKLCVRRAATGRGLFADEKIPKGACIIEYVGRPATLEEMAKDDGKYLFWSGKMSMINGNVPGNAARYINHSCAANCDADGPPGRIFIIARRRVMPGEELTYDYGKEYFDKHIKPKGCRCAKCRWRSSKSAVYSPA